MIRSPRRTSRVAATAALSYMLLGLPEGTLGVAWADIRSDFDEPTTRLKWVLIAYVGGYLLSSGSSGRAVKRLGAGATITSGLVLAATGMVGMAASPDLVWIAASVVITGAGGALIDSAANAWASTQGARAMNLLHGFFGVGALGGPLLVVGIVASTGSWRWVYLVLATVNVAFALRVYANRDDMAAAVPDGPGASDTSDHRSPAVLAVLVAFTLYVGLELSMGQWSHALLSDTRGLSDQAASYWVAAFWAGLAGGRMLLGVLGNRFAPTQVLVGSCAGILATTAVLWANPTTTIGAAMLPVLGLSLAGVFPAMMLIIPHLVGGHQAPHVIGYALAWSALGALIFPQLIGWLSEGDDVSPLAAVGFATAVVLAMLVAFVISLTRRAPDARLVSPIEVPR